MIAWGIVLNLCIHHFLLHFVPHYSLLSCSGKYGAISIGYRPSVRSRWLDIGQVLFLRVHKLAKKERGQYPAILTSHLVNKGFIIWLLGKFCQRDTAGSPERARSLHPAHSGGQSQRAISFILPARGASYIMINLLLYWPLICDKKGIEPIITLSY